MIIIQEVNRLPYNSKISIWYCYRK